MNWLEIYAFLWMIFSGYAAYALMDQKGRLKDVEELIENSHIYETMFSSFSPQSFVGFYAAVQILLAGFDSMGFALAYSYVPMPEIWMWAFLFIVVCYVLDTLQSFVHIRKFQRMFRDNEHPFSIMARYLRYCVVAGSPATYPATYGKCLIAVNLFLYVL